MQIAPDLLKQLQEELVELKQRVPGLRLKKSTPAQSPAAPFPITAAAEVEAPPAADRYDVASFGLLARLGAGVAAAATSAPQAGDASHSQQQAGAATVADAVEMEVVSAELPRVLRQAMAAELHRTWAASNPAPGRLNLAPLWATAAQQYVHLLTLVPEVLESYQSTDASGSTVRRWAILSDQTTVHIDASVHPSASSSLAAAAAAAAAAASAEQQQQQAAAEAAAQAAAPPLPRGIQQELDFLQKRHKLRQLPPGQAAADAAACQLAGLSLTGGGAQTAAGAELAATKGAAAAAVEAPMVVFELRVQPTDPAWDSSHPLLLAGSLAGGYPQAAGSLVLTVCPQQPQPLPELQLQVLDKLLAAEAASTTGRPGALRSLVRYVENHGGELWQQAEDMAAEVGRRRQAQAQQQQEQQAVVEGVPAASSSRRRQQRHLRGADRAHSSSSSSRSSGSELDDDGAGGGYHSSGSSGGDGYASSSSGTGSDTEVLLEGPGGQGAGGGGGHSDAVLPLQLQLEGLELIECDALEVLRLNLQLTCARCRAAGELGFATAAVALPSDAAGARPRRGVLSAAAECATCHSPWAVEVAPKLVHDFNSVLAHVRAEGCTPLDLLPSMLAGQCSHCAASAAFRSVAIGRWNDRACSSCHAAMRFQFSAARFVPHTPASRQHHGGGGGAAGRQQQQPGSSAAAAIGPHEPLQLVQPLPDKGTCKHYRHSYRWLRFPCCGKRFPCDLCHEELTEDGHPSKWATSMACGYCSLEQPVAPQCRQCGKKLATTAAAPTGRRTRFWEGGKGQRDPSKLHPGDPRRYRGKAKTQSAKSKRVGQEGKERRERRAAAA